MQKMMLQTSRQSGAFTDTESTAWFALTDQQFPGTCILTCVRTYELLRCRFHRNFQYSILLGISVKPCREKKKAIKYPLTYTPLTFGTANGY